MRSLGLIFFFLSFFSFNAKAEDIAFIVNMNYSQKELDALRAASGKKVISVPPESMVAEGEALSEMHDALMASMKKIRPEMKNEELLSAIVQIQLKGLDWDEDPALRDKLAHQIEEYSDASKRLWDKEKKIGTIDEQIRAKLEEFRRTGKKIHTLAISAHSDGKVYSGETSYNLDSDEINALQVEYPEMFENPAHVLLLGCYTMTKTNRLLNRELFPNASLIAGFYLKSYSRKNPMDWQFIKEVIQMAQEKDESLLNGRVPNENEIRAAIKKLSSVTGIHALIDYCSYQVEGIPEPKLSCEEEYRLFQPAQDQFQAEYLSTVNPLKDPPRQTDRTALREFYNQAQNVCFEHNNSEILDEDVSDFLDRRQELIDMAIRVIFWWKIQKNYSIHYSEKIQELKYALEAAGYDSELPALDGDTGRVEFVQKFYELYDSLKQAQRENRKERARAETQSERRRISDEKRVIDDAYYALLDAYEPLVDLTRVPLSWHKENAVTGPGTDFYDQDYDSEEYEESEDE